MDVHVLSQRRLLQRDGARFGATSRPSAQGDGPSRQRRARVDLIAGAHERTVGVQVRVSRGETRTTGFFSSCHLDVSSRTRTPPRTDRLDDTNLSVRPLPRIHSFAQSAKVFTHWCVHLRPSSRAIDVRNERDIDDFVC
jgi:hypothetical protein